MVQRELGEAETENLSQILVAHVVDDQRWNRDVVLRYNHLRTRSASVELASDLKPFPVLDEKHQLLPKPEWVKGIPLVGAAGGLEDESAQVAVVADGKSPGTEELLFVLDRGVASQIPYFAVQLRGGFQGLSREDTEMYLQRFGLEQRGISEVIKLGVPAELLPSATPGGTKVFQDAWTSWFVPILLQAQIYAFDFSASFLLGSQEPEEKHARYYLSRGQTMQEATKGGLAEMFANRASGPDLSVRAWAWWVKFLRFLGLQYLADIVLVQIGCWMVRQAETLLWGLVGTMWDLEVGLFRDIEGFEEEEEEEELGEPDDEEEENEEDDG
jgi:hypothetical protein